MPDPDTRIPTHEARATLALVIPLYNEEAMLPTLIQEIEAFRDTHPIITQIIFVDDGSADHTAALVRQLTDARTGYVLIRFSRNFGHQLAITAGLHFVQADGAVVMDADLQDPLWVIDDMVAQWRAGYDVVYGVRSSREGASWLQRATARWFYRFFQRMTDVEAPLDAGDFRLMSRAVIEAYRDLEEQQPYVRGLVAWLGFNQTGVTFDRPARAAGTTKYPWRKRLKLALDGIASFSGRPLRYAVRIGLFVSAASLLGLVWVVLVRYVFDLAIPGWSSLIFTGFFFGGLQLFFLGVVGSYVARVYEEVKARPRYVIRERWSSDPVSRPSKTLAPP